MNEIVDVTPLDIGLEAETVSSVCRISSYCRNAPFTEVYDHHQQHMYVLVGTTNGHLHVIQAVPAPPRAPTQSLQAFHVASVSGSSRRLQSTFAAGTAPGFSAPLPRPKPSAGSKTPASAKTPVSAKTPSTASTLLKGQLSKRLRDAAHHVLHSVDKRVTRILFSPQTCRVFVLCGGHVFCHFVDPSNDFAFDFIGALTTAPTGETATVPERLSGVIDFALTSARETPAMIAALTPTEITFCTFDSHNPFHINAVKIDAAPGDSLFWCSNVVCFTSRTDKKYYFVSPHSGTKMETVNAGEHIGACEMHDSWEYLDGIQKRNSRSRCALLVPSGLKGDDFKSAVSVRDYCRDELDKESLVEIFRFTVLTTTVPRFVFQWGPWLCIGTQLGLEIYSSAQGVMVQSICEESTFRCFSGDSRASQVNLNAIDAGVEQLVDCTEHEVGILDNQSVITLRFHSPRKLFSCVMRSLSYESDELLRLMDIVTKFAHSVGISNLFLDADVNVDAIRPAPPEQDAYDTLVSTFKDLNHPPAPAAERCFDCGDQFRFFRRSHPCAACGDHYCEKCAPVRSFADMDHGVRVCRRCYPLCHRKLRSLLQHRLFAQSVEYILRDDKLHDMFPPVETGQIILQRCLDEGKYALCISLLINVIDGDDNLWREWIQRFAVAGALPLLARYIPWQTSRNKIAPWVFTLVLTTLTTRDPVHLLSTIEKWPHELYDAVTVCTGIEAVLKRRQRDALQAYDSLKPKFREIESDEVTQKRAVGLLYRTPQIEALLRCVCQLFDRLGRSADAVRAYLEHWVQFEPQEYPFRAGTKKSATSVNKPWFNITQRIIEDDLKDLLMREEEKVAGTLAIRSFLPVLLSMWKQTDAASTLMSINDIKTRPELIKSLVSQLQDLDRSAERLEESRTQSWGPVACPASKNRIDYSLVLCDFLDGLGAGPPKEDIKNTAAFHKLQAELYIKHRPEKLVTFLRNEFVSDLDWDKMDRYLRERGRYRELAYVVSRNGNFREALRLIMRCQKSSKYAIDFVTDVNGNADLWAELMYHARQSPKLINDFLEHAANSSRVNVAEFLRLIPAQNRLQLDLDKVRPNLINATVNAALNECSVGAIKEDNLRLFAKVARKRRSAVRIGSFAALKCGVCDDEVRLELDGLAFSCCGHLFHLSCLERQGAKPRLRRARKPRSDWSYWWGSYELHKESAFGEPVDLAELLPPQLFQYILTFLPMEPESYDRRFPNRKISPRASAMLVSKAWYRSYLDARLSDRPEADTDQLCVIRGALDLTTPETTVILGNDLWRGEPKCPTCAKA